MILTTIFSNGVHVYNGIGVQSKDVYRKREALEVILIKTQGEIKGEYLFKVVPLGRPLLGRSKVRGIFRSSSIQESS